MRLTRVVPACGWARFIPLAGTLLLSSCGGYGGGGMSMPPPLPSISMSVQPTSIVEGQSATLKWSASNASSCMASGAWTGTQAISGSMTITPTAVGTGTYTLNCTDMAMGPYSGSTSAMMSVTL